MKMWSAYISTMYFYTIIENIKITNKIYKSIKFLYSKEIILSLTFHNQIKPFGRLKSKLFVQLIGIHWRRLFVCGVACSCIVRIRELCFRLDRQLLHMWRRQRQMLRRIWKLGFPIRRLSCHQSRSLWQYHQHGLGICFQNKRNHLEHI